VVAGDERCVVVKAGVAPAFVVVESELAFELAVVELSSGARARRASLEFHFHVVIRSTVDGVEHVATTEPVKAGLSTNLPSGPGRDRTTDTSIPGVDTHVTEE
jgi:hypothetical protein